MKITSHVNSHASSDEKSDAKAAVVLSLAVQSLEAVSWIRASRVIKQRRGDRVSEFFGCITWTWTENSIIPWLDLRSVTLDSKPVFQTPLIQCRLLKHDERTFVRDRTRHPHVPGHPDFVARHLRAITKATSWAGPFPKHRICLVVAVVAALCVNRRCCVRRLVVARCGGLTFCPKIVIFLFLSCHPSESSTKVPRVHLWCLLVEIPEHVGGHDCVRQCVRRTQ